MKFLGISGVVVFLAVAACFEDDYPEDLKALNEACIQEVQTTKQNLDNFFNNGMKIADANKGVKCHVKCMLERQGQFKNSKLDDQVFVKKMQTLPDLVNHQAEVIKATAECKEEKGTDDCDTAFKIIMCFTDKMVML